MMKVEAQGVLKQLLSIKSHAENLLRLIGGYDDRKEETGSVLTEYEDAKNSFAGIVRKENVDAHLRKIALVPGGFSPGNKALLREVHIECEKGIEVLRNVIVPLSEEELERLESLREELQKLSTRFKDPYYEPNVVQAIDEYERGHMLASVLISSRIIIYVLQQIPGNTDEERISFLREKGVIEKKREDTRQFILKASHKARDFFSHDLKLSPSPSDALSLLGDTLKILELTSQLDIVHGQKKEQGSGTWE